jgi:hypothetical protein
MEHVSDNDDSKAVPVLKVVDAPAHQSLPCGEDKAELHEAAIAMVLSDNFGSNS